MTKTLKIGRRTFVGTIGPSHTNLSAVGRSPRCGTPSLQARAWFLGRRLTVVAIRKGGRAWPARLVDATHRTHPGAIR